MGGHHSDVAGHIRSYFLVFGALAVFTVLTVAASFIHVSTEIHVAIALAIATVKATLVAAIFMHLKWERGLTIWWSLLLCAVFFTVLMLLPSLTVGDDPPGVVHSTWDSTAKPASAASGH